MSMDLFLTTLHVEIEDHIFNAKLFGVPSYFGENSWSCRGIVNVKLVPDSRF